MAQTSETAPEAAKAQISAGQSMQERLKDRDTDQNADIAQPGVRETSVSQNEIMAEKIVSAKDGTVTQTQMTNHGNIASAKNVASTKYNDNLSSELKSVEPNTNAMNSTKIVHTMHINGAPAQEGNAESSQPNNKHESKQSQQTITGEQANNNRGLQSDGTSQIIIDGISVPGGESNLNNPQSQDNIIGGLSQKNPSTLQHNNANTGYDQQRPIETLPPDFENAASNANFKPVGVTSPIYGHVNLSEDHGTKDKRQEGVGAGQMGGAHKRLMDRRKNQQGFPMKVTDLNSMVQIKKKKPKMKYNDKLVYRAN